MASDNRFAVLIDADNVSVKYIKIILDEISKDASPPTSAFTGTGQPSSSLGKACCWTTLSTIQQYSYTTGKNSTDPP